MSGDRYPLVKEAVSQTNKLRRPPSIGKAHWRTVHRVLKELARRVPDVWPSERYLARKTGFARSTIQAALASAERVGLITRQPHPIDGHLDGTRYDLCWLEPSLGPNSVLGPRTGNRSRPRTENRSIRTSPVGEGVNIFFQEEDVHHHHPPAASGGGGGNNRWADPESHSPDPEGKHCPCHLQHNQWGDGEPCNGCKAAVALLAGVRVWSQPEKDHVTRCLRCQFTPGWQAADRLRRQAEYERVMADTVIWTGPQGLYRVRTWPPGYDQFPEWWDPRLPRYGRDGPPKNTGPSALDLIEAALLPDVPAQPASGGTGEAG